MRNNRLRRILLAAAAVSCLYLLSGAEASAQTIKQISATARGTSTQMGRIVSVDLRIYEFSTADDQKVLLESFQADGSEGLANALDKMKSKGRIAITGTIGYDVNYIREFKMPDGSVKIRFVTDRPIRFGEAWASTRTMDYAISMGEIIINKEKSKSVGTLMPASKVKLNKQGELEIEAYQNPWELVNIRTFNKK
ncbi:MAG TPA: hypothetical protein VGC97_11290 [Pyrinomonadaceae bacterium]|jgi:hypothetical protein